MNNLLKVATFIYNLKKKKGRQYKAGRERFTSYQFEDHSPTILTRRKKEEK